MKTSQIFTLVICFLIPMGMGAIAGFITTDSIPVWYTYLNKPAFNPPDQLFGPVWTVLYILMGFSLFLAWKSKPGADRSMALIVFGIQLALNFAWTIIFFYFRQTGWAFFEIILLWICILAMIRVLYRVNRTASWLQVPYLLWVSFAGLLNGTIWWLN